MSGELSGEFWNSVVKEMVDGYLAMKKQVKDALLISGYPPFTYPLSPREQYDKLLAMRDSGDPGYWNDPRAQAELLKLAARFGAPQLGAGGPYGTPSQAAPLATLRATQDSARLGSPPGFGG